jgi:hypothetical protein
VERRLDAAGPRRWLIGGAGVVGGVIGASQLMVSNLFQYATVAIQVRLISTGFNRISTQTDWLSVASSGGLGVWIAAGAAVVMMGFVLTRAIGEI